MIRVLLVDDSTELSALLALQLRRSQFEVHCADSCAAARAAHKEIGFQVLVTDLNLPDGDGLELARTLGVPVRLALTGSVEPRQRSRFANNDFDAVLLKPIDGPRLVLAIHRAMLIDEPAVQ